MGRRTPQGGIVSIQEECATAGTVFDYEASAYALADIVAVMLEVSGSLADIHRSLVSQYAVFDRKNDQSTVFHRRFYDKFADLQAAYSEFMAKVIRPRWGDRGLAYQRIPTFRVHLPGNLAVGEFHRDSDYGHSKHEVNYWVPLTECWGTNAVWIESQAGAADYLPRPMHYGQVLEFDGANLMHGNKVNETGHTRVSFDLRVLPLSAYEPSRKRTVNTGMPFTIGEGGYFSLLE